MEGLIFMLPPFAACLTLIGIHGYFGIHVLKRGIIFIDIAMAQIAALGVTLAYVLKIKPESGWTTLFSLALVIMASYLFSTLKCHRPRICIEAIIGITYAVASTLAVLLIDRAAGSDEHIKEMLIGSILWVEWPAIVKSLIVYGLVGIFHGIFRNRFIALSENAGPHPSGFSVRLWDFLFYATLGIVVMHSVRIGGILVVFAFLIIPSTISALFFTSWKSRILFGWISGAVVSGLGLWLSWIRDVPSGPAVVLFLGLSLGMGLLVKSRLERKTVA